ncbi:hypothetical protein J5226_16980 [Lysobacter sp. K5869]|uniref:ligand-binding sensor domain-containing protein n=1 Tax=Lysobacter sp. K5869 TaxID=2820808 RepID=UPI001C062DED|nr:two-component regulator propeller domain-containing protein [Lysobacter sp. K5869]QWP75312.1 hypothetical protein J5226_16980 [Lysobacter sp. K5869]
MPAVHRGRTAAAFGARHRVCPQLVKRSRTGVRRDGNQVKGFAGWLRAALGLLAGLVLSHAVSASAPLRHPDYRVGVHAYGTDDGLPPSGVNAIVQTRDGYLWIGTFGGLARFDGLTFTTFRNRPALDARGARSSAQAGPVSDRISALLEDRQRRLWIGTQDAGLSVYAHGRFRPVPVCGGTCQINTLFEMPGGELWIASSAGLFVLDPASEKARWIDPGRYGRAHIARDGRGRVYVAGADGLFAVTDGRLRPIPLPAGDAWVRMLKRSGDELLIGTDRALYRYEPGAGRWRPLGIAQPTDALQAADGRWWVATASGQLLRERGPGRWSEVRELSGVGVTRLGRDDEGNLWIGSGNRGLLRVRSPLFGLLPVPRAGLNIAGRAILADGRGGLWLGSACGGLRHWREGGPMPLQPLRPGEDDDCVTNLAAGRDGALLVGTAEGNLFRVVAGESTRVGNWSERGALNVWAYGDRFLIGLRGSTLEIGVDGAGRPTGERRIEALRGLSINNLVAARRGGYWFVGDGGAWRVLDGRIVEQWTPREGLSSRFARALYEDPNDGTLWIGTYGGGLNRIRDGRLSRYDSRNGLIDDTVSCILPDHRGRLWLAGNRGVTLLPDPAAAAADIESIGYGAEDGLIPAEVNGGHSTSCHRDSQGRLWFSMVEGYATIDPRQVPGVRPLTIRSRIEGATVGGREQNIAGAALTLPPFAQNLEIRYTGINLSRPRDTYFRFRLLGFDHDWVEAGKSRSVLYASVPWGEHVFEVQARTLGGRWSPLAASLRISNPQPWYLRPWILILATALGLVILVGATQIGAGQDKAWPRKDD